MSAYWIEHEFHNDRLGHGLHLAAAKAELDRFAQIPWGAALNIPPCGHVNCRRGYRIVLPAKAGEAGSRAAALNTSAKGVVRGSHA